MKIPADVDIILHSRGSQLHNSHGRPAVELLCRQTGDRWVLSPELAISIGEAGKRMVGEEHRHQMHTPLPVAGYSAENAASVALVNEGKQLEERTLRYIEKVDRLIDRSNPQCVTDKGEGRFLSIGRTDIQKGWMMIYRAIFNPGRIRLPEDPEPRAIVEGDNGKKFGLY